MKYLPYFVLFITFINSLFIIMKHQPLTWWVGLALLMNGVCITMNIIFIKSNREIAKIKLLIEEANLNAQFDAEKAEMFNGPSYL